MGRNRRTRKLVILSVLLSISIVLSIVERFIPFSVTGAKLGLANIVTLIVMYLYGEKDAFLLLVLRVLLVGLLSGSFGAPTFFLSVSGGITAIVVMVLLKQVRSLSIVSVSLMGSLGHSVGQIAMAMLITETLTLVYYFPVIFLVSIPTGIFVGYTSKKAIDIAENTFMIKKAESV